MLYGTESYSRSETLKEAVPISTIPSHALLFRWASQGAVVANRVDRGSLVGIGIIIDVNVEPTPLQASLAYRLASEM
jgi:hypothetical protein